MADTLTHERIDTLTPWSANAQTHSPKQVWQIATSIETFGFTNPVLIDDRRRILAGHGRVAAAHSLGQTEGPCLQIEDMTEDQKRAYVIADNRLAEQAGRDRNMLSIELGALAEADLDFDLGVMGFDPGEIDLIIGEAVPSEASDPADENLPTFEEATVTQPGDVWRIGAHRIICGDVRDAKVIGQLMAYERARVVLPILRIT